MEPDDQQVPAGARRLASALERAGVAAPPLAAAAPITLPGVFAAFVLAGPAMGMLVGSAAPGEIGWPAVAALVLWAPLGGHLGGRLVAVAQRRRLRELLGFDPTAEMWLGVDADRLTFWRRTTLGRPIPEPLGSIAVAEWRGRTTRGTSELTTPDGRRFRVVWQSGFDEDVGRIRWILGERPDDLGGA